MTSEAEIRDEEIARDQGLVRGVGTWGLSASIVNGVIGAGIFSLPAAMVLTAGSMAPWAFVLCALVMAAVVICFAEAASRVPTSGGSYGYVEAALGPLWGFVAGMLVWLSAVLACGGIVAAFAGGLGGLVPALASPGARAALIVVAILLLGWINVRGVDPAARFIGVMTAIKLIPLVIFILVGGYVLLAAPPAATPIAAGSDGLGRAVILALFAFSGMETPLAASGEVARPERTIPRALFLAMGLVALLYIAIQLVAQGLMGGALAHADTPLADAIQVVSPGLALLLLAGATFSRLIWIASDLFGAPRVLFAFARDGLLPPSLARLSSPGRTPHVAIWVHAGLAIALGITGTFEQLAILSSLATAALYFLACAAAWILKRRGVALFGRPLTFAALPLAATIGMISMAALVALAEWVEIAGLAAVVAGSALLFALQRRLAQSRSV